MAKTISATNLRSQLGTLLDQLQAGETHFVIERNNQPEAVLLSMQKFQEIMQMLEMLNRLEYIGPDNLETVRESEAERPEDWPDLDEIFGQESGNYSHQPNHRSRSSRSARSEAIESAAARLGIRVIK